MCIAAGSFNNVAVEVKDLVPFSINTRWVRGVGECGIRLYSQRCQWHCKCHPCVCPHLAASTPNLLCATVCIDSPSHPARVHKQIMQGQVQQQCSQQRR